jgi:hypothetical protein
MVSEPPPALVHRLIERAGGRAPPRVLVLELVSEVEELDGLDEAPATAVRIFAADRAAVAAPDG